MLKPIDATILAILRQSKVCPSYPEIAALIGRHKSVARDRIYRMMQFGFLHKEKGSRRAVSATKDGSEVFPELVVVLRDEDGVLRKLE